jgi:hypothetical protein
MEGKVKPGYHPTITTASFLRSPARFVLGSQGMESYRTTGTLIPAPLGTLVSAEQPQPKETTEG